MRLRPFALASAASTVLLLLATIGPVSPAAAHEHVHVGEYELVIGWRVEPPFVGVSNGLDLGVMYEANGTAVIGAEATLTATLSIGNASMTSAVRPQFGRPGWYTFNVIPTVAGIYSVRIVGSLGTTDVDATVQIQEVRPASDVEFPTTTPTASELEAQLDRLASENAALSAQMGTALLVAVAGVLVGLGGLAAGAMAWRTGRKRA